MKSKLRSNQKTATKLKTKLVIGTCCFLLISLGIFIFINASNLQETLAATFGFHRISGNPPKNNSYSITKLKPIESPENNSLNLQAYYDRNKKTVKFTFNTVIEGIYSYVIYDKSNREVRNGVMYALEGENSEEIDMVSLLSNTFYSLELDNGTTFSHIKIKNK